MEGVAHWLIPMCRVRAAGHLYKEFEMDSNLIEEFKATTLETADIFEKNTKDKSEDKDIQVDEES